MYNMTFSDQIMTLTLGQILFFFQKKLKKKQEEHDTGKMNVVSLLSQKLLPKNLFT